MPTEGRANRADDIAGGHVVREYRRCDGLSGELTEFRTRLRSDRDVGSRESRRLCGVGEAHRAGARHDLVGGAAIGNDDLADRANDARAEFALAIRERLVDFGPGGSEVCEPRRGKPRDLEHTLFGDGVALRVALVERSDIRVRCIDGSGDRRRRDQAEHALALFEKHRGIGLREAGRYARFRADARDHQPLREVVADELADFAIGEAIGREKGIVALGGDLSIEPRRARQFGDFRIDEALRNIQAVLFAEFGERAILDQQIEQGIEVGGDVGIDGLRIILARGVELTLERLAHVRIGDLAPADLGERAVLPAAAHVEVRQVRKREAGEDQDQEADQKDAAEFRLRQIAEFGGHG